MSTNLAEAISQPTRKRPAALWHGGALPAPVEEPKRTHLEVVSTRSQRRARPRTLYAAVAVGTLLTVVVAQLLLSIGISQGAYQLNTLQAKQAQLQRSYQAVSEDLNRVSSPQNLAANANALGMVSNSSPAYLRLSDGAVLGAPLPADGAAGTVTGAQGNLVPNALLAGVPLVTQPKTPATAPGGQPVNSTGPGAATPAATTGPVPLEGALPTPVTH
ncbi:MULTISPECIES: hypothetical protein [unclassified Leifsonia]|uniref:hypothetical protein n=1 Tax=unclassified Leifsonia TaxID=2663824 RepID=UPI0008A79EA4|nr:MULTISPECIES: hypothetical protein [unclassified Leifsonia]SEH98130.1 hypothetical protein SAMN04515694_108123 [Leifsonia sp. CL154]SFL62036.1 hypothetical protein SAMN04515692_10813 [Leifsonia sp. CL147]